jgi:hypothetical protein
MPSSRAQLMAFVLGAIVLAIIVATVWTRMQQGRCRTGYPTGRGMMSMDCSGPASKPATSLRY